ADRHGIAPLFVLFDSVWDPLPQAGKQRDPKPHVHNSGWVQGPSVEILKDPARYAEVEPYVTAVLTRFREDSRILGWDLYNEPGNNNANSYGSLDLPNKEEMSLQFLEQVYRWARDAKPSQPLTVGVWMGDWADPQALSPLNRFMLDHSDFISFHSYAPIDEVRSRVESLVQYGRPIVCTEYMARTAGSTFNDVMPYLKEQNIGAYNWGLVSGKTQTIYPWESWTKEFTEEPSIWFHDILRPDGTPFDPAEVQAIRELTGAAAASDGE
ncbi:MAG: glycoside hydrolase family protein, partial [Candidatus Hydrogenedentes bacterium]|nr:glycoside hydrolase family protein [Candidatus Hydrogenedentota bacterium]